MLLWSYDRVFPSGISSNTCLTALMYFNAASFISSEKYAKLGTERLNTAK